MKLISINATPLLIALLAIATGLLEADSIQMLLNTSFTNQQFAIITAIITLPLAAASIYSYIAIKKLAIKAFLLDEDKSDGITITHYSWGYSLNCDGTEADETEDQDQ